MSLFSDAELAAMPRSMRVLISEAEACGREAEHHGFIAYCEDRAAASNALAARYRAEADEIRARLRAADLSATPPSLGDIKGVMTTTTIDRVVWVVHSSGVGGGGGNT